MQIKSEDIFEFKAGAVQAQDLDAIWSKALGAFANNEGGVVVWGIQAKRNEAGIDAAQSVSFVPNVDALKQKLLEKYQFLTDPVLAGTEVVSIPHNREQTGFVVCFIPEGVQKPYRSIKAKQPYYIRIKDDSVEIPHNMLRQLFAPSYTTRLQTTIRFHEEARGVGRYFVLTFTIKNVGLRSISTPYAAVLSSSLSLKQLANDFYTVIPLQRFIELHPVLHPEMESDFSIWVSSDQPHPARSPFKVILFQPNETVKSADFIFDFQRKEFWDEIKVLPNPLTLFLEESTASQKL
jgi:hypothetical protein